nr:MAG TPA: hypothetical protein [Caudoviricetes sp.]
MTVFFRLLYVAIEIRLSLILFNKYPSASARLSLLYSIKKTPSRMFFLFR